MFDALTLAEWDALCSHLERALTHDIPGAWPDISDHRNITLTDELLTVHGELMLHPVTDERDQNNAG